MLILPLLLTGVPPQRPVISTFLSLGGLASARPTGALGGHVLERWSAARTSLHRRTRLVTVPSSSGFKCSDTVLHM